MRFDKPPIGAERGFKKDLKRLKTVSRVAGIFSVIGLPLVLGANFLSPDSYVRQIISGGLNNSSEVLEQGIDSSLDDNSFSCMEAGLVGKLKIDYEVLDNNSPSSFKENFWEEVHVKKPIHYIIRPGDNYEKIQVNENLKRGILLKLNPDKNPKKLIPGERLVIGYEGKMKESYKRDLFSEDSDEKLLARMLFGEVRGQSDFEKYQVAYSALNRANNELGWDGRNLRETLVLEGMYNCFDEEDVNWSVVNNPENYDSKEWGNCLKIAHDVLSKNPKYRDMTRGATHYHNPKTSKPSWRSDMKKVSLEGTVHDFYKY